MNSKDKGDRGEIWKDVIGYEGLYQVSNWGDIRSIARATTKGRTLKQYVSDKNGYCYVSLCKNNSKISKRVHVLIMKSFFPTEEAMQVNHIDGVKTNNKLSNLELVTQSENMKHAYRIGLEKVTWNKPVIRLDDLKIYDSLTECAIDNNGKKCTSIHRVCVGQRSNYKGKRFAFYSDYQNGTIPIFNGKYSRRWSD